MKTVLLIVIANLLFAGFECAAQNRALERRRQQHAERFVQNGPKPGEHAPDFELKTTDGEAIRASILWKQKPTVIMTASYTCPVFRNKAPSFDQLTEEFTNQVHFLMVYTIEAHPKGEVSPYFSTERVGAQNVKEGLLFPQPKTLEERIGQARICEAAMKLNAPMVIDTIDNATWKAYGGAPNAAYLVGRDGRVLLQQGWFEPGEMREAILKELKPDDSALQERGISESNSVPSSQQTRRGRESSPASRRRN